MTGALPRVVALMPTWNATPFLAETLASLRAQTYPALTAIVSDDASTDGTPDLTARLVDADPRFQLLRSTRRRGWVGNSNRLLRAAKDAEFLLFAFHDDPLEPDYVARLVAALSEDPGAVLAFADVTVGPHRRSYPALDGIDDPVERGRRLIGKEGDWWIPNRGLFRASAATRLRGLRRHLGGEYSADWPWLLGLALQGRFVRVPAPLVRKVFRQGSVSNRWKGTPRQALGVTLSCARTIATARLPWRDRLALEAALVRQGVARSFGRLRATQPS